ncbi:MAG: MurT ligase domain-containing protein [Tissierellia bacterium]|nr:MurT ligase domain-containing protein [Tissierellia bacterium]
MKVKAKFAKIVAKITRKLLNLMGRNATSLPGLIAYKIDNNILDELGKNTKFIYITGTNGKTMTTHFITNILKNEYDHVITNKSGSNMIQGITTALLDNPTDKKSVAVLEIDEANVSKVMKYLKPDILVITNIFRDQMDRFAEIYNVLDLITRDLKKFKNLKVIANGDLPLFSRDEIKNLNTVYFGIRDSEIKSDDFDLDSEFNSDGIICPKCESVLKYRLVNYSSLGEFKCPNCDFKSPKLKYKIEKIIEMDANFSKFIIDDEIYEVNVGGFYNIYNALSAISCAKEMDIDDQYIYKGLKDQKNIFGRQEKIKIENKEVIINLVKNPTGLNQIIRLMNLEKKDLSLICLLNDNYADGIDISWIYDSYYEKLKDLNIKDVYTGGKRRDDMKRRLEIAEIFDGEIQKINYEEDIVNTIKNSKSKRVYILATYTAMMRLREVLNLS